MIIFISHRVFKIEDDRLFILLFHFVFIFLTNNVLFSPSYMGDQFTYLDRTVMNRGFPLLDLETIKPTSVIAAGYFFAYFPMPLINSIQSISMINYLLFITLYIFLKQKKVFTIFTEFFFLLFPSLMLYSSVGLRDIPILFCMILFLYYFLVVDKKFVSLLFLAPLFFFKFQNAGILLITAMISMLFNYKKLKLYQVILFICAIIIFYYSFKKYLTLDHFNYLRFYFYHEENPDKMSEYTRINSWMDLVTLLSTSFFRFIMDPLPWTAESLMQLFQSFENIVVLVIIIWSILRFWGSGTKHHKWSLNFFYLFSMALYSLFIINAGTAARYRFTFVVCYIIFYHFFGNIVLEYKNNLSNEPKHQASDTIN